MEPLYYRHLKTKIFALTSEVSLNWVVVVVVLVEGGEIMKFGPVLQGYQLSHC